MKGYSMQGMYGLMVMIISVLMLSACGSAPVVKSSKHYDVDGKKVEAIDFVYYKSKMSKAKTSGTPSPYKKPTTGLDDIRYESFGGDLVNVAEGIFKGYGVSVRGARESEVKIELSGTGGLGAVVAGSEVDLLYLFASSGKVTTNQHMVRANYVFQALLINPVSRKIRWRAVVDTSAWAGRDFVMKSADATVYDETYAKQLLTVVAEKMKLDGVISGAR